MDLYTMLYLADEEHESHYVEEAAQYELPDNPFDDDEYEEDYYEE